MKLTSLGRKEIIVIYLGFLTLTSLVAWVYAHPPQTEQFASVSVLGSNNTATDYFPNNTTTITLNEEVQWYVQTYNRLGSAELFLIYVKLANADPSQGPNATGNTPSQGPAIAQFYRVLMNDETWNLPLAWSVTGESTAGGSATIQNMTINGSPTPPVSVSALNGKNFRIIIELWSYDAEAHSFIFSFEANEALKSVFNQIYFDTA